MSTEPNTQKPRRQRGPYPRIWVKRADGHETTVSLPAADYARALQLAGGSASSVAAAVRFVLRSIEAERKTQPAETGSLSRAVRAKVLARLRGLCIAEKLVCEHDATEAQARENNAAWDALQADLRAAEGVASAER